VEECLTSRRLRPDLFFRLGVFPILVPPLRSRSEDVEALALHFAKAKAKLFDLVAPDVSAAALLAMVRYRWPGNVRELEHAIERAVALCDREIGCEHLGLKIVDPATTITRAEDPTTETMKTYVKRVSMDYGLRILAICGGDRRRAAKVLGISMAKFYRVLPAPKRAVAAS
jgi:DNA-binding NtrC family response regulator